jgi:porcupine-like protein
MVLAMKVISVGFDMDSGLLLKAPGISEFMGYAFNVGTVIFGPWISFLEYMTILQLRERKMVKFQIIIIMVISSKAPFRCFPVMFPMNGPVIKSLAVLMFLGQFLHPTG